MIVGMEEILIKPLYSILMKNNLGNIKECKTLIKHNHVYINGQIMNDFHYRVNQDDVIFVDDQQINAHLFVYYLMNKPKGYICANHDKEYPCVVDFIQNDCSCIGRLDRDTTGLLLLSNDKSLMKHLLMPQFHVEKTYLVTTLYPLQNELVDSFHNGVIIDQNIKCEEATLEIIDDYHCQVTLHEGKYHQIKKMFLSCQNQVIDLKRISFGGIILDSSLKEGEYRDLNEFEFQILKELLKQSI